MRGLDRALVVAAATVALAMAALWAVVLALGGCGPRPVRSGETNPPSGGGNCYAGTVRGDAGDEWFVHCYQTAERCEELRQAVQRYGRAKGVHTIGASCERFEVSP